jgi:cytokinin dehydrogenase
VSEAGSSMLGRRQWLAATAATLVVAFDPVRGVWLSRARAHDGAVALPDLDGELVFENAALEEAADDFGHIVHDMPWAVLRARSSTDVQRMVRFVFEQRRAHRHGLTICMRGQAHSTHGQAQAVGGVVIDSRGLDHIASVGPGGARVGPGVRWLDLLNATLQQGLTPPVLTDFIELSVGGTLSVGGIGGATQQHGLQVDNVLELEVVTGRGQLVTCSPRRRRALFESVLGGLGQLAIIVGATIRLIPAPSSARVYQLFYTDLARFTRDQRRALQGGRFDYLEGQVLPQPDGSYQFLLEAAAYYTPPGLPDDAALLAELEPIEGATVIDERSYFDWQNRLAPLVQALREGGAWGVPHPWFDVFLPSDCADAFIQSVLDGLQPEDIGGGPILCYPFPRSRLTRPFVAMPDADVVVIFGLLRFAAPDPALVDALVAQNRVLFESARDLGAKRYAIGSVPFSPADWADHFGERFPAFAALKARFDPGGVLTPGQHIFPRGDSP